MYAPYDIPTKILTKHNLPEDIEGIFLEINFRTSKWLLCGIYLSPFLNDQYFFDSGDKALDIYCSYEKIVFAGDLNAQEGERLLDTFLYQHQLHSINKNPTCYKHSNNPTNKDLTLTNCSKSFFKHNFHRSI